MELFEKYPRVVLKDRMIVFSKEHLEEILEEAKKYNKACIVSLYSFEEIKGGQVTPQSAIIDKILWEGSLEYVKEKCSKFDKYAIIFDGEKYLGIVFKESTVEELERLQACTQLDKMILYPGSINLKTKKTCKVVEEHG